MVPVVKRRCTTQIEEEDIRMTLTQKRLLLLAVIAVIAFVLGRLAVRGVLNLLVGGTLFGGNFL